MVKKIAFGTITAFVVLFLAGLLVYVVLMKDAMAEMATAAGTCMNAEPSMLHITLAILAQSLLLAAVLYRFGVNSLSAGAMAAGWVTLLIVLWFDIWFVSSMPWFTTGMMIKDVIINTIMGAVAGGAIGLVFSKVK